MSTPSTGKAFYISGPMSGYPCFNIPLFDRAAAAIRRQGWTVISPAELDEPEFRAACLRSDDGRTMPPGANWGELLARDVRILANDIGELALLPGWQRSRGARVEVHFALEVGITKFWRYYDDTEDLAVLAVGDVRAELARGIAR